MDNRQIEYQQILTALPATSVILYDDQLNIIQDFDRERILEKLLPGKGENQEWAGSLKSFLQTDPAEFLLESLEGTPHRMEFNHPSGDYIMHTTGFKDAAGMPFGVLVFQQREVLQTSSGRSLVREKEEAEENNEMKSRFLARISHEIRTPLNAIIGFVEQLQKTALNEKQKNFANIIEKSSEYLLDLVNEVLSFSRLESGEVKLDEVDFNLEGLIHEIYDTLKVRASEKSINLRYRFDENLKIIFLGDAFRLKQLVMNLVNNAIKFTEYGYVEIGLSLLEEKDDRVWIRITVSDTGIGIAEKKLKDIFDEYKQASAGIARKHGGSGLGLTITKRLTKVMQGTISVESKEGKGSVFTVELPLKKSQRDFLSKDVMQVNSEELSGMSALLVDDDAMNRALGQIIMEGFNMEVSLASEGREVMEIYKKGHFDVVLLDIHMPDISGLEVANFIRNEANDEEVKIIAVTADILQEDEVLFARDKIDDVLIKPYREINLYSKICQVLDVESKLILKESIEIKPSETIKQPVYDLSELRAVTRENHDFFNEMIETFIENATEGIEQIRNAFKRNDWEEMQETAHRLIPSFKHLEIKAVVSELVEIKSQASGKREKELLKCLIENIDELTREVIEQLKNEKYSG